MTQSRYHCHTEKDAQDLVTSPSHRNSHIFSCNLPKMISPSLVRRTELLLAPTSSFQPSRLLYKVCDEIHRLRSSSLQQQRPSVTPSNKPLGG